MAVAMIYPVALAVLEGTKPLNDAYDEVRMCDGTVCI